MITINKDSVTIEATNLDFLSAPALLDLRFELNKLRNEIQFLETYCDSKRAAMECWVKNDAKWAKDYERVCERMKLERIPAWAKW